MRPRFWYIVCSLWSNGGIKATDGSKETNETEGKEELEVEIYSISLLFPLSRLSPLTLCLLGLIDYRKCGLLKPDTLMAEAKKHNSIFHSFDGEKSEFSFSHILIVAFLLSVLLGIFSGYFISQMTRPKQAVTTNAAATGGTQYQPGDVVGSKDTASFKDSAEGTLEKGGIDGEGQFHLVRPGGESQNVYLTSSNVDLAQFIKRKIRVFGETHKAEKAGWLMEVGRVEILE